MVSKGRLAQTSTLSSTGMFSFGLSKYCIVKIPNKTFQLNFELNVEGLIACANQPLDSFFIGTELGAMLSMSSWPFFIAMWHKFVRDNDVGIAHSDQNA